MPLPDGLHPTKILAVHVNFRSRAEQRGRVPLEPSYFLKPPSSISAGGPVARPQGAELMSFEGEIAIILHRPVRDVSPKEGAQAIGWYAPANDLGVYDFRWADRGSNVLAKGHDGFTPIGPTVRAADVDLASLRLRTRVNGEIVQDARPEELIFPFGQLVADLSRFMTLERGDMILTGTPAGAGVVGPGDVVEVQLDGVGVVSSTIVEAPTPLAPYGAMPRATAEARALANGTSAGRPVQLTAAAVGALRRVSTATLTSQLGRRGIRDTFLAGLRPTRADLRMVGYARTLRYVATREDVRDSMRDGEDAQKRAVESVGLDDVLVIEARGETSAGTIGDILAARVLSRGGAGIVTDGGARDSPGLSELEIATYYKTRHAASLWNTHIPLDLDTPITCAGVLVMPGDVVVGDAEGVVVLPAAMAEEIAQDALEQESREEWALEQVRAGESIRGVYPLRDERREDYARWRANRESEKRQ
ncbi:MAG TPA: fumarylacetoacetate hydrolase family protein [Solirubrobacteraceae bacterium]|nr:fumarylacetoacetate hydrolase family protein [Solirubrobacteraceae bacterium]